MALRALRRGMGPGQRETGRRMIERGVQPVDCRVADAAILRETGSGVIRIVGLVEIREVAGNALRAQRGELAVCMALVARERSVRARELKPELIMVEGRPLPTGRRMADAAILRETGSGVVRVVGFVEIGEVAGKALRAQRGELSVRVALIATECVVRPGEREFGRVVVERCALPVRRRMADAAILREAGSGVIRVVGLIEIGEVAGNALCAQRGELPVRVALVATERRMRAG